MSKYKKNSSKTRADKKKWVSSGQEKFKRFPFYFGFPIEPLAK